MPAKGSKKKLVVLAIKIAFTAGFFALLFAKVSWSELWSRATSIAPSTWFAVFACFVAGHAVGALKWRYALGLSRARITVGDAFQCYAAGMFANLCLPSIVGGDAVKAVLAGRASKRFEAAVIGGATERLIDTFALLVLIVVGALMCRESFPGWAQQTLIVAVVVGLGGALLFLPLVLRVKLERWPKKLRRPIAKTLVSLRRLARRPAAALAILALSLVLQSWFVVLNAWLGAGIGVELPLATWFFAIPFTKAVTLVPISFGGFGLREKTLAGLLLAIAAVPEKLGAASSILWQTVLVATGLLCGLLFVALGWRANSRVGSLFGTQKAVKRG
ncbi:MAG: flippase-like domain-containing protein [Planctomycetes bacterium]|nr:flippase-like domain-containing protein [Planctomycetota bacterium]